MPLPLLQFIIYAIIFFLFFLLQNQIWRDGIFICYITVKARLSEPIRTAPVNRHFFFNNQEKILYKSNTSIL